jgi:transcriptional regulator with XRE-family HTH domain
MPRPKGASCPLPRLESPPASTTLAERIELAMRHASPKLGPPVTQSDLARALGLDQSSINNLCRGSSVSMKAETAVRMALVLRVNVHWLVTGDGPMSARDHPVDPPAPRRPRKTATRRIHDHVDEIHRRVATLSATAPAKRRAQMFGALRAVLRSFEP